jgi:BlaI family transcriptional regulator, penicillinase repressor
MTKSPKQSRLSPLEHEVMKVVWERAEAKAENVQQALAPRKKLKDSTVRTLLRRLEEKGILEHRVDGRTFIYRAPVEPQHFAANAIRQVVDQFCGGSVGNLLAGMVNDKMVTARELRKLAEKIEQAREAQQKTKK